MFVPFCLQSGQCIVATTTSSLVLLTPTPQVSFAAVRSVPTGSRKSGNLEKFFFHQGIRSFCEVNNLEKGKKVHWNFFRLKWAGKCTEWKKETWKKCEPWEHYVQNWKFLSFSTLASFCNLLHRVKWTARFWRSTVLCMLELVAVCHHSCLVLVSLKELLWWVWKKKSSTIFADISYVSLQEMEFSLKHFCSNWGDWCSAKCFLMVVKAFTFWLGLNSVNGRSTTTRKRWRLKLCVCLNGDVLLLFRV